MASAKRQLMTVDLATGPLKEALRQWAEKHPELSRHALAKILLVAGLAALEERPERFSEAAAKVKVVKSAA